MSSADAARYLIVSTDDAWRYSNALVRVNPDGSRAEIFNDAMEPEDATLLRDLKPLAEELNAVATQRDAALDALEALLAGFKHVCSCLTCGKYNPERCARREGESSDAAKAIRARRSAATALHLAGRIP